MMPIERKTRMKYATVFTLLVLGCSVVFLFVQTDPIQQIGAQVHHSVATSEKRTKIEYACLAYLAPIESQDYRKLKDLTTHAPRSYWQPSAHEPPFNGNPVLSTSVQCCSDQEDLLYDDVSKLTPSFMGSIRLPVKEVLDVTEDGDTAKVRVRLRFKNADYETLPNDIFLTEQPGAWKVFKFSTCFEPACVQLFGRSYEKKE